MWLCARVWNCSEAEACWFGALTLGKGDKFCQGPLSSTVISRGYFEEVAPGGTLREGDQEEEMEESTNSSQEAPERWPLPEPGMSVLVERMLCAWHRAGLEMQQ